MVEASRCSARISTVAEAAGGAGWQGAHGWVWGGWKMGRRDEQLAADGWQPWLSRQNARSRTSAAQANAYLAGPAMRPAGSAALAGAPPAGQGRIGQVCGSASGFWAATAQQKQSWQSSGITERRARQRRKATPSTNSSQPLKPSSSPSSKPSNQPLTISSAVLFDQSMRGPASSGAGGSSNP